MEHLRIRPMQYYTDRGNVSNCIEIADDLLRNRILLWKRTYLEPSTENIFDSVFKSDDVLNREYLFGMDYLSALLSAYKQTGRPEYRERFLEIVDQFLDYAERVELSFHANDDFIPSVQTLMFIKSFSLIQYEEERKDKIIRLLYSYAQYCYDDCNHADQDNHGLFADMALLHLSVLFGDMPEAMDWRAHAVERVRSLFHVAFYEDGFNNEGSITYFQHNIVQYRHLIEFCEAYGIPGLEDIRHRLDASEETVFRSFAHSDDSFPLIGDGQEFYSNVGHNEISNKYPDAGICVVKTGEMYLTFKCKTTDQRHAHVDVSSITARFRSIDLALDSGQFNYDRYYPINRYLRTSGGHSAIFPLFADGLALREYLDRQNGAGIERFEADGFTYFLAGGYELDDGAIQVRREIVVAPGRIEVRDSWSCTEPQNMRQRFILPEEFLRNGRFTASKKTFETMVDGVGILYEITSKNTPVTTAVNFGVQSRRYGEYDTTVLLDTVAEYSRSGEIITVITVHENGKPI